MTNQDALADDPMSVPRTEEDADIDRDTTRVRYETIDGCLVTFDREEAERLRKLGFEASELLYSEFELASMMPQ